MAGNRELVSTLSDYSTFAGCSRDDVKALVEAGGPFALPSGWPLVQQGIPADACYVLTEGTAAVYLERDQIAELGPGDLIGEASLLGGGQRNATVTSTSRIRGLRVDNDAVRKLIDKRPKLAEVFKAAQVKHGG